MANLSELMAGSRDWLWRLPDGSFSESVRAGFQSGRRRGLLAGSFNPLHEGHVSLRTVAGRHADLDVAYELSVLNVDKAALTLSETTRRVSAFTEPVLLTRSPTFLGKAKCWGPCTFVVGVDTAIRVLDPRYYDDSVDQMHAALEQIGEAGCDFLVAGRVHGAAFIDPDGLAIPDRYAELFRALPATEFRVDLSSSEIRAGDEAARDSATRQENHE